MSRLFCGSGEEIEYREIIEIVKQYTKNNAKVFVGTDSQVGKIECMFSTAICLHGADNQKGGRYFFKKTKFKTCKFPTVLKRIMFEVERSVQLSLKLYEECPEATIEIHLDISSSDKGEKTSSYADMLIGYAKGVGFECKVKPESFAASSIADKHSK